MKITKKFGKEYHREWRKKNPEKAKAIQRRHYDKYPDRSRELSLKRKYNLTIADVEAMILNQNGKCAICKKSPKGKRLNESQLHVDHDHQTKTNRGMLCGNCNRAIGLVFENSNILRAMINYLENHKIVTNLID